jgi:UDP-glucuronate decarboxylase
VTHTFNVTAVTDTVNDPPFLGPVTHMTTPVDTPLSFSLNGTDLENDGRVVSNFIMQSLCGQEITIYGKGSQTRSFCYVDDLVEGMIRLMNADGLTGPVNLGNPGEFTVLELAEMIIKLTKSRSKLSYKPLPQDDPTQRCPDISIAKKTLGWTPTIQLEEGLKKTIAYFEARTKRVKTV